MYRSVSPASLCTRMYDALYALHCKRSIRLLAATPYSGRNPDQDVARSQCTDRALDAIDDTLHGLQKILVLSLTPRLPHYRHNKTTVRVKDFFPFPHRTIALVLPCHVPDIRHIISLVYLRICTENICKTENFCTENTLQRPGASILHSKLLSPLMTLPTCFRIILLPGIVFQCAGIKSLECLFYITSCVH